MKCTTYINLWSDVITSGEFYEIIGRGFSLEDENLFKNPFTECFRCENGSVSGLMSSRLFSDDLKEIDDEGVYLFSLLEFLYKKDPDLCLSVKEFEKGFLFADIHIFYEQTWQTHKLSTKKLLDEAIRTSNTSPDQKIDLAIGKVDEIFLSIESSVVKSVLEMKLKLSTVRKYLWL